MTFDATEFKQYCETLAGDVDTMAAGVHKHALEALEQCNVHGNINPAVWLVTALGKKHRAESLKQWFVHFGKFAIITKGEPNEGMLCYKKRKDFDAALYQAEAEMTPFYDYKPEAAAKNEVFDLEKELRALLKRAANIKAGKSAKKLVHDEYEDKIKALLPEAAA